MLHPIWINIGLIINMFKHFLMYISWWEDLCLFYDDKIFRAQGILLCCHHSVSWALLTPPEGASLCLFSAKPRLKRFQLLVQKVCLCGSEVIWNMRQGWKGRTAGAFAAEGQCSLSAARAQNNSHGDGRGSDLERLVRGSASKRLRLEVQTLENMHKSEQGKRERERETKPGTGKALKSPWCFLHKWGLTVPLEASGLDFLLLFLYWQKQVLKQVSWSGKVWWELKTSPYKWRGYSLVPM